MEKYFKAAYDETLAFDMYQAYIDGCKELLNDLMIQLYPLVRRVFNVRVGSDSDQGPNQGYLEGEALTKLLRTIKEKRCDSTTPRKFSRYFEVIILNRFRDVMIYLRKEEFDYDSVCKSPYADPFPTPYDIESKIYCEQTVALIRRKVKRQIRFFDKEREACLYILDRELGIATGNPFPPKGMFNLTYTRATFLMRYVKILLKKESWEYINNDSKNGPLQNQWRAGDGIIRLVSELW